MTNLRALLVLSLLFVPAQLTAQTLETVPFDKQLQLAKVGDVDAQFAVGLAYETGRRSSPTKPRLPSGIARPRCRARSRRSIVSPSS